MRLDRDGSARNASVVNSPAIKRVRNQNGSNEGEKCGVYQELPRFGRVRVARVWCDSKINQLDESVDWTRLDECGRFPWLKTSTPLLTSSLYLLSSHPRTSIFLYHHACHELLPSRALYLPEWVWLVSRVSWRMFIEVEGSMVVT